jgi:hypothetical protein
MSEQPSKATQILDLYEQGHTTRVIAWMVYGLTDEAPAKEWDSRMAYIRVVVRQRKGRGMSPIDARYVTKKYGSLNAFYKVQNDRTQDWRNAYYRKRREDPAYRAAKREQERARRARTKATAEATP